MLGKSGKLVSLLRETHCDQEEGAGRAPRAKSKGPVLT
jgi:hypothetical protein